MKNDKNLLLILLIIVGAILFIKSNIIKSESSLNCENTAQTHAENCKISFNSTDGTKLEVKIGYVYTEVSDLATCTNDLIVTCLENTVRTLAKDYSCEDYDRNYEEILQRVKTESKQTLKESFPNVNWTITTIFLIIPKNS